MSSHSTVHASGIAPTTTEKDVRDFFSFWYATQSLISNKPLTNNKQRSGKIVSLSITPVSAEADAQKSASVTFEKEA